MIKRVIDLFPETFVGVCQLPQSPGVDIAHSIFDPAKVTTTVPGGVTQGSGNLNVDPLFADAANGNLALSAGSPAIDSGDPAGLGEGDGLLTDDESATDRAGNIRFPQASQRRF